MNFAHIIDYAIKIGLAAVVLAYFIRAAINELRG